MNQEIRPSILGATPISDNEPGLMPGDHGELRPLLLRRDLAAMLPYLNRTEFCRRQGWEQARQVDCGFKQVATVAPQK